MFIWYSKKHCMSSTAVKIKVSFQTGLSLTKSIKNNSAEWNEAEINVNIIMLKKMYCCLGNKLEALKLLKNKNKLNLKTTTKKNKLTKAHNEITKKVT